MNKPTTDYKILITIFLTAAYIAVMLLTATFMFSCTPQKGCVRDTETKFMKNQYSNQLKKQSN